MGRSSRVLLKTGRRARRSNGRVHVAFPLLPRGGAGLRRRARRPAVLEPAQLLGCGYGWNLPPGFFHFLDTRWILQTRKDCATVNSMTGLIPYAFTFLQIMTLGLELLPNSELGSFGWFRLCPLTYRLGIGSPREDAWFSLCGACWGPDSEKLTDVDVCSFLCSQTLPQAVH